ncbi:UNVERIFIED_ORG: hypothetical protein GGI66_006193 [Rhizobium esperanzae]
MDRLASLTVFVKAVELGSISAAAQKLNLSSQLAGKHLRALEHSLGIKLLNRTTRRQHLTESGQLFYERAKNILAELEAAESLMAETRSVPRGRLRISAPIIPEIQSATYGEGEGVWNLLWFCETAELSRETLLVIRSLQTREGLISLLKLEGRYVVSGMIFRAHVAGRLEDKKAFLDDLNIAAQEARKGLDAWQRKVTLTVEDTPQDRLDVFAKQLSPAGALPIWGSDKPAAPRRDHLYTTCAELRRTRESFDPLALKSLFYQNNGGEIA